MKDKFWLILSFMFFIYTLCDLNTDSKKVYYDATYQKLRQLPSFGICVKIDSKELECSNILCGKLKSLFKQIKDDTFLKCAAT